MQKTPAKKKRSWLRIGGLIALAILLLVVVGLVIAAWVVDRRYAALRDAPRISHETIAKPHTVVRIVVDPSRCQELIEKALAGQEGLPGWVVSRAVPYEMALLFDVDLDAGKTGVTVFVNERRFGPVIVDSVNQAGVARLFRPVKWTPPGLVRKDRGILLLEGTIPIDAETLDFTWTRWVHSITLAPLEIEGNHLAEAVFDNRDGKAYAVISALWGPHGAAPSDQETWQNIMKFATKITSVRFHADLVSDDELSVQGLIECNRHAEPGVPDAIKFFIDMANAANREALAELYGIEFEGSTSVEGMTVKGGYSLRHVDKLLALVQGGIVF